MTKRISPSWLYALTLLAATGAFVFEVALRARTSELERKVSKLRADNERLIETERVLEAEVASLERPSRLKWIAEGMLEMSPPEPSQIVVLSRKKNAVSDGAGDDTARASLP